MSRSLNLYLAMMTLQSIKQQLQREHSREFASVNDYRRSRQILLDFLNRQSILNYSGNKFGVMFLPHQMLRRLPGPVLLAFPYALTHLIQFLFPATFRENAFLR